MIRVPLPTGSGKISRALHGLDAAVKQAQTQRSKDSLVSVTPWGVWVRPKQKTAPASTTTTAEADSGVWI